MRNLCRWSVAMALFCSSCAGQQIALLNAPEPESGSSSSLPAAAAIMPVARKSAPEQGQGLARTDWALLGAGATLRFLDYKSTVKAMSDPKDFHEEQLPNALVHCRPGLGAYEAGMVAANYYAYRFFAGHRHRRLARWGQAINLAALGWTVGRNYYELNAYWPRQNTLRNSSE